MAVKEYVVGGTFSFLWFFSIFFGYYFLYCPFLPLLFFHRSTWRKITDSIFAIWEIYAAALVEILCGTRIFVCGDVISPKDSAIFVMNHRNRLDWNYFWCCLQHSALPVAHVCKFVLKFPIKWVPGLGWIMQMTCFLYIRRQWGHDQVLLAQMLDYFRDVNRICQILLFPEGTDLSSENKKRSHAFALEHDLPCYENVLHPRTTGFAFLVDHMRQNRMLDAVYDITVAYPDTVPQTEADVIRGNLPKEVHFLVQRHAADTLPTDDIGLREWCRHRWQQKEAVLEQFAKVKCFPSATKETNGRQWELVPHVLYLALAVWTWLVLLGFYYLLTSSYFQMYFVVHTIEVVFICFVSGGFEYLEIAVYNMEKRKKIQ